MTAFEKYQSAKKVVESAYLGKGGCHTVAIGFNKENGVDTGELAVVCYVSEKMRAGRLLAQGELIIPPVIHIDGVPILTDVQEMEPPHDLRLKLGNGMGLVRDMMTARNVTTHRQCHNTPIPGGVQIAPRGANWVGTLSCALRYQSDGQWRYGALTNAHVSGMRANGQLMCQPSGNADWFAKIHRVVDIHFDERTPNYIDAAILDVERTDGQFAPSTHTVYPKQLDIGDLVPTVRQPQLGDTVIKSGRTTGITRGRCVGVEGTSYVGYDEGTALFQRQLIVEGSGSFSAGGDSGSLVLFEQTRQPWGLLFAGGGNQTICNPISFVLDWGKAEFYSL